MNDNQNPGTGPKQYIDPAKVNKAIREALESLREMTETAAEHVRTKWMPTIKQWASNISDAMRTRMVEEDVEFLGLDTLTGIIKENKADGAEACIVHKKLLKDGRFRLVATFMRGDRLLPAEENVNIVIECEGMSRELKDTFGDNEVIIIK